MQTYRHKIISYACIVLLLCLGFLLSQVIFSVLYDPYASRHIFVPSGQRVEIITTTGYRQLYTRSSDQTRPFLITDRLGESFQQECPYGIGQCHLFAYQDLVASLLWIDLIQYIGKQGEPGKTNTITNRIHRINTLSPRRVYPYIFAVLMGPSIQTNNQKNSDLTAIMSQNAITIGEAGIRMTCDTDKVDAIRSLSGTIFIKTVISQDSRYRNPCEDYRLPYFLAFDYYYHLGDYGKAIIYYKVASMHTDAPSMTASIPFILENKKGDHYDRAMLRYHRRQQSIQEHRQTGTTSVDNTEQSIIGESYREYIRESLLYLISQHIQKKNP